MGINKLNYKTAGNSYFNKGKPAKWRKFADRKHQGIAANDEGNGQT